MRGLVAAVAAILALSGCASPADPQNSTTAVPGTASVTESRAPLTSSAVASPAAICAAPVVALDPGHNPVRIESFDPKTGVAQIDYPNGAEDADAYSVASQVATILRARGYRVVLLKRSLSESVSYRQRVDRAEKARAAIGISIHTSPGVNAVFPQRIGLYREGTGAGGTTRRVTFRTTGTAASSQRFAVIIAGARSRAEGHRVPVQDNDFGGRSPLWSGNIPIISLLAQNTPWVYNEFSPGEAGGSVAVAATALRTYARGIAEGISAALPRHC
ncbi:hypothetical protein GOEFS_115_00530 [Gordonia effusa NBRC 100432]|uniref:MurNAc-LAA domain-containing protein n=1 Tax=Gordonia effusa NBRC 100432 TaxID=1077974 RepID=H0R5R2_9ACTN|nr:N-acetylmuramoyl-L-alanine amidase [Gordonia effusa]GAB20413.1 hypothetical protein GOEFS_115_00530 [Gordonia effusa NBRC 100432]